MKLSGLKSSFSGLLNGYMDLRVGSKWVLRRRIGAGSFGEIYSGEHILSREPVAVKLEQGNAHPAQLLNESRTYRFLAGGAGIPSMRWYGVEGDFNVMVMDLLGKSLHELFELSGRKFTLKTVLMIADQMLGRIEYLHTKGVLHRDIKPENFVMGIGEKSNVIFVIDFGLSKRYQDAKTGQHIPFRQGKPLLGTARYSSINTHLGIEQSRRDDLEAIAYVLIYFLKGTLPWIGLKAEDRKQKQEAIAEQKLVTSVDALCQDLPPEFGAFLSAVRRLDFTDRPDYEGYRRRFRELFMREGYVYDSAYDWLAVRVVASPFPLSPEEVEDKVRPGTPIPLAELGRHVHPSAPILAIPVSKRAAGRAAVDPAPPRGARKAITPTMQPVIAPLPRALNIG